MANMQFSQFLIETADEDRAIISLATTLFNRLGSELNKQADLGTIGELVDTPLTAVNKIHIKVMPAEQMAELYTRLIGPSDKASGTRGMWVPDEDTIYLNSSLLDTTGMRTVITHELRHALDDMKSDYRAGEGYKYNEAPKGRDEYHAQPAEINARFAEVMHYMTAYIAKQARAGTLNRDDVYKRLYHHLENKKVSTMFPERTESRAYKQLLKRAVAFLDKELAYRKA